MIFSFQVCLCNLGLALKSKNCNWYCINQVYFARVNFQNLRQVSIVNKARLETQSLKCKLFYGEINIFKYKNILLPMKNIFWNDFTLTLNKCSHMLYMRYNLDYKGPHTFQSILLRICNRKQLLSLILHHTSNCSSSL